MLQIVNIVFTFKIFNQLNLAQMARVLPNFEYNPQKFHALLMRVAYRYNQKKATVLIFKNGKIVVTNGGNFQKEMRGIARRIEKRLIFALGNDTKLSPLQLRNIVGTKFLNTRLTIDKIVKDVTNVFHVFYDATQFPALRLIEKKTKCSVLIFANGKMIISGIKHFDSIAFLYANVEKFLNVNKLV